MSGVVNRKHILDLRDTLHNAISAFGMLHNLGPGELAAPDTCVALAMVMRDIVQSAPDSESKARILNGAITALAGEMTRPQIIMPPRAVPAKAGHA